MLRRINIKDDMAAFGSSEARAKLASLIEYVSTSVMGISTPLEVADGMASETKTLLALFGELEALLPQIELVGGPQRFGNPAFRIWHENATRILASVEVAAGSPAGSTAGSTAGSEPNEYLGLSFGNPQRLDYGTGHELAFLAFFGSIVESLAPEDMLIIWDRYYRLSRAIIQHYKLEPAGSHGVWGLDDHYHLCYVFGASQLLPRPGNKASPETPTPEEINDPQVVARLAPINLYFSAIKFITSVKRGPFHEHSPLLYNASGAANWTKIRNGMTRMYTDNVFDKFPVVQHFVFGRLYRFEPFAGA